MGCLSIHPPFALTVPCTWLASLYWGPSVWDACFWTGPWWRDPIKVQDLLHHPLVNANHQEAHPYEMLVKGYKLTVFIGLRNQCAARWWQLILRSLLYLSDAKRVHLKCSDHKKRNANCDGTEELVNTLVVTTLQFIDVFSQHILHLKATQGCVSITSQ